MASTKKLERQDRIQAKRKSRRETKEVFRLLPKKAKREFRTGDIKSFKAFLKKQQESAAPTAAQAAPAAAAPAEAAPAAEAKS